MPMRTRRPWRCELNEPQVIADDLVVVLDETHHVDVELLGPVDIAHRDSHQLKFHVHATKRSREQGQ
jgi:hypothetical protein